MSEIILNDKNNQPTEKILEKTLGATFKYYTELKTHLFRNYDKIREEWKYYGRKYGWQLKIFHQKRNLLFIVPSKSYFKVVFIFGDRAMGKIEGSEVAEELKEKIKSARKYAEGRGLSIDVKDATHQGDIRTLVEIKLHN